MDFAVGELRRRETCPASQCRGLGSPERCSPLLPSIPHFCSFFLFTAFGAILQSSLFGLAGLLPASYTAPIMSGQGLAGTFAALAMIFSIASE